MSTSQKTIIALHGAGMNARAWELFARQLPCQEEVFLPLSLPGHGDTAGPLLTSIAAMAVWVEARLKDYPPQSVILLGHSMGALVALEAARHPAVAGLVLAGAAAHMPVHPDLLKQAATAPEAAATLILKWGISPSHPEASEILRQQMQPVALANDLTACNTYQNGEAAAKRVRQPALVLSGADDKMTKAAAGEALTDMLPHARFHLVLGGGHMLMVENPVEMAREIGVFTAAING